VNCVEGRAVATAIVGARVEGHAVVAAGGVNCVEGRGGIAAGVKFGAAMVSFEGLT